jgi:hypothetical protein
MSEQPFLFGDGWIEVKDGNDTARAIFDNHYSRYVYADGRKPKLFMGPGEKMVLLSVKADAVFGWRKFISRDAQDGVNCAIFRNQGDDVAHELILAAERLAWARWPGERFYTYVDPRKVTPTMVRGYPVWGWCFFKAGWRFSGVTKSGKIILDKEAA